MWTVTASILTLLICLWLLWRKRHFSVLKELGIVGPEPNLIFGNILEMARKNPLTCQAEWISRYGKVFGYYSGLSPMVVVADPDLLKRIQVSEFQKFINRPVPPFQPKNKSGHASSAQLVDLRDKRWKDIRSILTPSFTASKLKAMTPIIDECIDDHLEILERFAMKGEDFDISEKLRLLSMDIVGGTSFGIQTNFQKDPTNPFMTAVKTIFDVFSGDFSSLFNVLPYSFPELGRFWRKLMGITLTIKYGGISPFIQLVKTVTGIIKSRREGTGRRQDLLQLMIDARLDETQTKDASADDLTAADITHHKELVQEEAKTHDVKPGKYMTEEEIRSNSILFFVAGFETMGTAMSFTVHFLVHFPHIQQKVREEINSVIRENGVLDYNAVHKLQYLDQVFREATRFYPPIVLFVSREVSEDVDLGGLKLKKGLVIQVPVYNIHHDPDLWSDPEMFKPERFSPENRENIHPMAYQAFGAGPRNCIGMRFALTATKLCLARIIKNYKLEKCEKTDELKCKLKCHINTLTPANGVYIKATKL